MREMILIALLALLWGGCSNSASYSDGSNQEDRFVKSEADSLEGMVRVHATGASTTLGTDDKLAKLSERPAMTVEFSYDFSIGRREVTCGEYNRLMEGCARKKTSIPYIPMKARRSITVDIVRDWKGSLTIRK